IEMDFFGSRPSDVLQPQGRVFNQPRLRKGYLQLGKGNYKVVAGQDDMIISPLDPISLSHVGVPLGATAGDLWARLPQLRLDVTHSFSDTSTLFHIGILRPVFGDPRLGDIPIPGTAVDTSFSGFGERASQPFYQARIAAAHPFRGSTATVGAGVHYGEEAGGAKRNIPSWAFALDFHIPLQERVVLRGEGFVGSNLAPFQGGILQGVAALPLLPQLLSPRFIRLARVAVGANSPTASRTTTRISSTSAPARTIRATINSCPAQPAQKTRLPGSATSAN